METEKDKELKDNLEVTQKGNEEESLELNSFIDDKRFKHTIEQKTELIAKYIVTGNLAKVCEDLGISYKTAQRWKYQSTWWDQVAKTFRNKINDDLDGKITKVLGKTIEQLEDLVENGEEIRNKEGSLLRKKIGARDLAIILGTLYDKRALIRCESTTLETKERFTREQLQKELKDKMEEFAKEIQQKEREKTIIQVVDNKENKDDNKI